MGSVLTARIEISNSRGVWSWSSMHSLETPDQIKHAIWACVYYISLENICLRDWVIVRLGLSAKHAAWCLSASIDIYFKSLYSALHWPEWVGGCVGNITFCLRCLIRIALLILYLFIWSVMFQFWLHEKFPFQISQGCVTAVIAEIAKFELLQPLAWPSVFSVNEALLGCSDLVFWCCTIS